jgi:hypothetical protein
VRFISSGDQKPFDAKSCRVKKVPASKLEIWCSSIYDIRYGGVMGRIGVYCELTGQMSGRPVGVWRDDYLFVPSAAMGRGERREEQESIEL